MMARVECASTPARPIAPGRPGDYGPLEWCQCGVRRAPLPEPGEFLASGRAADVFDQGDGTVLRRYRTEHNTEPEARLMSWLHESGYPVPVVHHSGGRDIVMERISGPTMLEDLERRPWSLVVHTNTLARLQQELNEIAAPDWLHTDQKIPRGSSVLHLDFHPMNVILSPRGPLVIDWTNARRGDGDFDAALSYILMAAYEAQGIKEVFGQWLLTRAFRRRRGAHAIQQRLVDAANFRLQDRNVTTGERAAIQKILDLQ